ncbi:hypothetical protein ONZ45_g18787 [Pleurotus djamor]|nr:hypothetical protein ONZ45_g18787 [Pleurotus djamor]
MDEINFVHSGFMPVNVWYHRDGQVAHDEFPRVPVYHPLDAETMEPDMSKPMFYVPPSVDKGGFFMLVDDVLARTGQNVATETEAIDVLSRMSAPTSKLPFESEFSTWKLDEDMLGKHQTLRGLGFPSLADENRMASLEDWAGIVRQIADADLVQLRANYPIARFFKPKPASTKYRVSVVPLARPTWVRNIDATAYRTLVTNVLTDASAKEVIYQADVIDAPGPNLRMIGHNFLCLYDLYATEAEYRRMIDSKYTTPANKQVWPIRKWPTRATANSFDNALKLRNSTNPRAHTSPRATQTRIEMGRRYLSAERSQPGVRSQEGVMHGSANKLAEMLINGGTADAPFRPGQDFSPTTIAEWLHRVCFTAGGPTLQEEGNFCFGTSECNTHMIQAENAVLALFDTLRGTPSQRGSQPNLRYYLTTTPHDTTTGARWLQNFANPATPLGNTDFVRPANSNEPYVWAIPFLDYRFTVEEANGDTLLECAEQFDTFNRYIPLSLMGRMDNDLLKRLLDITFPPSRAVQLESDVPSNITDPLIRLDYTTRSHPLVDRPLRNSSVTGKLVFHRKSMLFGIAALPIDIYRYQGSLPAGVKPPTDGSSPLYEEAKVSLSTISQVFPKLSGGPFDLIPFLNYKFVYQNCQIDKTKQTGWSFECNVDLAKSTNGIQNFLRSLFGTSRVDVQLAALLMCGPDQTWETPLSMPSFVLIGALGLSNVNLGSNLKLLKVGIKLHAVRTFLSPSEPYALRYSMELFGEMSVTLPSSYRPSIFDFSLTEASGIVSIRGRLQGGEWKNVLGITNFKLQNVCLHVNFSLAKRPSAFDFGVDAEFDLDETVVGVSGKYASRGKCELTAWLSNFSLQNLVDVYKYIFGAQLKQPDVDVTFGEFTLSLSTSTGVGVSFNNVVIDKKYTIEEASARMTRTGIELRAAYSGNVNVCPGVDINQAQIALSFGTGTQKSYFWISGKTTWSSSSVPNKLVFDVSAYFYKDKQSARSCPEVLKSVGLRALSMLVASSNDIELGPLKAAQYKVRKGVTVCAEVGKVDAITGILKGGCPGIQMFANYPDFALGISLPTSEIIDFGRNIKTRPIEIVLNTRQRVLSVSSGIVYQPQGGSALEFDFWIELGLLGASATLRAKANWNNPLGLCPQLTIQEVALMIGLRYATFLIHGPNQLGISGRFKIGYASPNTITLIFGDDPSNLLLQYPQYEAANTA